MFRQEKLITPGRDSQDGDFRPAAELAARGNYRRLRVFLWVFIPLLIAGVAYTFSRPPEYRAQARISVKTAGTVNGVASTAQRPATVSTENGSNTSGLQAEAGLLTSRPLIESALSVLRDQGIDLPEFGSDRVLGIQAALTAEPVAETNIINLSVVGREPAHLAPLLNALIDAYSRRMSDSYSSTASTEIETLREELADLNQRIAEKRKALEEFRQTADIVSGEREENQILARVKGLSNSLNLANDKVAQAEGRVRSIKESQSAGKAVVRSRDNPTLAALEARASLLRESLREQERTYTPQFMAMDPNVRGMRSRLADLENQIAEQKTSSGQILLAEAEDELAAARQAQQKLQAQIAEDRRSVHAFSRNFSAYKAMEQELAQIESSRSNLSERLLRTETSERSRKPSLQVIEAAATPLDIWRPDYLRDTGISFAVAIFLALGTMALVEVFNRPPPSTSAPEIMPQSWITLGHDPQQALPGKTPSAPLLQPVASQGLLPKADDFPRELSQDEIVALLKTLPKNDAVWATLLLCGALPDEIRRISPNDFDALSSTIRLRGTAERLLHVPSHTLAEHAAAQRNAESGEDNAIILPDSDDELARRLLCAAHDAGLDSPAEITVQALRHTYIAYLVGQGLRFSELDHIVGPLPADTLAKYADFAPIGTRRRIEEIDPLMPALKAG